MIQQPALPAYRIPFFRRLSEIPDFMTEVWYSRSPGLPNVKPRGFTGREVSSIFLFGGLLAWDKSQWRLSSKKYSDVVILSWNIRYLSLVPALLRAKYGGVKTLLWGHGRSKSPSALRDWLRTQVAKLASGVVVYDANTSSHLIKKGFVRNRVHVAPNAIDQRPIIDAKAFWSKSPRRLSRFISYNHLSPGPVILFVSRLLPENRVDLLLHASEELLRSFPHLRVAIIGDGPEYSNLRAWVNSHRMSSCITLTGSMYDELKLAPWFLAADVFCYPENIGLSVLHALGYGLPVVTASDPSCHNPEFAFLFQGRNASFFRRGDVSNLVYKIRVLLVNRKRRRLLSRGATYGARHQFTLTKMVSGMSGAIKAVTAEPR